MKQYTSKNKRIIIYDYTLNAISKIRSLLYSFGVSLVKHSETTPPPVKAGIIITADPDIAIRKISVLRAIGCSVLIVHPDQLTGTREYMIAGLISALAKNGDSPDSGSKDPHNMSIEVIKESFANNEFFMNYQPIIETSSGAVSGFESLIRWRWSATGELIPPDRFIPVIENSDFMVTFGFWIINEVCKTISEWISVLEENTKFRIGINLSAKQFTCVELVDRIISIIAEYRLDPSVIALEITESSFFINRDVANLMLLRLKAEKILVYLDDFGMGFSSLSYLLHFPVDVLKIDMSFVRWMHVDEQSEAIVRSVVALAHNLKLKAVAEGVEVEEHVRILKEIGCDYMQGFFYSKPLSGEEALKFIRENPR